MPEAAPILRVRSLPAAELVIQEVAVSAEAPLIEASQNAVLPPTQAWPLKAAWWVGDVWAPLIEVLDPLTRQPTTPTAPPVLTVKRPDDTAPTAPVTAAEGGYRASVTLNQPGTWTFTVTLPATAVQVIALYVNPLPS